MIATLAFNPFQPSVAFDIETSLLICSVNQKIGFLEKCNTGLKWVQIQIFTSLNTTCHLNLINSQL